ncbi:MAG: glycogen-binding domain-containing protein [Deltaproteobacteria bacterium]|jgi:1,4-alpha-glucan branching enzyme|nr:glycogen-binding domain-containing protein [Deltaproteobacteria bacterium]
MATQAKNLAKTKKKVVKKATGVAKKAKKKPIPSTEFSLYAPDATEVYLAGDFNGWESDAKDYKLRKFKGDIWKKKVRLKSGRYEYQFVVDGQWWCDPENDNRVTNPYCTENSVVEVK